MTCSVPDTITRSAREARSVLFSTFRPASATWPTIASVPITNAVIPWRVSASRCCIAPPTVTTSASDAWMPMPQSLRT